MKILNLYAGIGGNRKLWGDEHEVTAVEINPEIAKIYHDFFPGDKVIVTDAHEYLLQHFKEFDFIWSSPPCPTHSRIRFCMSQVKDTSDIEHYRPPKFPDMKLYEEIIFLTHFFKGKFVVENVIGYYEPLIKPKKIGRHYYWANFILNDKKCKAEKIEKGNVKELSKFSGFNIDKYKNIDKRVVLRNCVNPEVALEIFNFAFKKPQLTLGEKY